MTEQTFTDRRQETVKVKSRYEESIEMENGWSCGVSPEVYELLPVGKEAVLETIGLSRITGWLIDGQWYDHKSDQDLEREAKERQEQWRLVLQQLQDWEWS